MNEKIISIDNDNTKKIKGRPHPIDEHVGKQIRLRRKILGLSQGKLGEAIGLTFQQVQKYERGANRIGASRLYELSKVLNTPVSYFFDGLGYLEYSFPAKKEYKVAENKSDSFDFDWLSNKELLELVKAYNKIKDPQLRKQILDFTKSLAQHFDEDIITKENA